MEKNFLASKTIWGTIFAVLPTLLAPMVGQDDGSLVSTSVDQIITGVGGLLAVWGRFSAKKALKVL